MTLQELLNIPQADRENALSQITYEQLDALMFDIGEKNNTINTFVIGTYKNPKWFCSIRFRKNFVHEHGSTVADAVKNAILDLCINLDFEAL